MANTVSPQGVAFSGGNEGFVSHYYKDPGGVGTIGHGFTWMSAVFREYWMKTRGHKLRAGDTITKAESLQVLAAVMAAEYAPPVAKFDGAITQNEFDAATDTVYNCGPGTLKDRWAAALKGNNVSGAAQLLRSTRITAGGRQLAGLVKRRAKAAELMLHGVYGVGIDEVPDEAPAQAAADTRAAVKAKATKAAVTVAPASATGGAVTHINSAADHVNTLIHPVDIHTLAWTVGAGIAALAVIGLGYLIYSHRGVILRKRTPAA
jgi:GH24 family phage-related lysozyme (muramidase)